MRCCFMVQQKAFCGQERSGLVVNLTTHEVDTIFFIALVVLKEGTAFHSSTVPNEAFVELSVDAKPDFNR